MSPSSTPWPEACATGVGSMPGTEVRAAVELVLDTLTDFPNLPELPARGPGADLTGRALGLLLADLPAEWGPNGWVVTDRPGRDGRRAAGLLCEDLDTLEELLTGWQGPVKAQLCGPWTLAATLELRSGRAALSDPGAVKDVGQALAEATAAHVADLQRRLPGAVIVLQVDEPALPAVLAGSVPTPSGLATLAAVDDPAAELVLAQLVGALPAGTVPAVHCCAPRPPLELLVSSGFRVLSLDDAQLGPAEDDLLAEAVESGVALMLGVVRAGGERVPPSSTPQAAAAVRRRWARTGQPASAVVRVAVTPGCGLAGASPAAARAALTRCADVARALADDPERADD
jgi:methionine synthase II (cobalamin-independent)